MVSKIRKLIVSRDIRQILKTDRVLEEKVVDDEVRINKDKDWYLILNCYVKSIKRVVDVSFRRMDEGGRPNGLTSF